MDELVENLKEYLKNAERAFKAKEYNTAVTLYFKTLTVLSDILLLKTEGRVPSNHDERFKTLREKHRIAYQLLDKNFPLYQQTYRIRLSRSQTELIRGDLHAFPKDPSIEKIMQTILH